MQAGAVERFANVDIAQARDQVLIQERRLDRRGLPGQTRDQIAFGEPVPQRLRPDVGQQGMAVRRCGVEQVHRAETPCVIEGDARPAPHVQDHMVMLFRRGVVVVKFSDLGAGYQHPARHAQMDQKRLAGGEVGQDVFRPPPKGVDPCAGQPLGHARRKGPAQIGAVYLCLPDHLTLHHRHKTTADGFNLGQFGHGDLWR